MMNTPDRHSFQTEQSQAPREAIGWGQFRALHRALENADLMSQREDLELKRRAASKRGGQ